MKRTHWLIAVVVMSLVSAQSLARNDDLVNDVTVTASSSDHKLSVVADGAGLDESGLLHSDNWPDMWSAHPGGKVNPGTTPGPAWLRFNLGAVYEIDRMVVWNMNEKGGAAKNGKSFRWTDRGLKNVTVEYSITGGPNESDWTTLGEFQFARGPGTDGYSANTEIDLGGLEAKYVVITIAKTDGNWGYGMQGHPDYPNVIYALSEVRFFGKSRFVRQPVPADKQRGVRSDIALSWTAALGSNAYDIYFGTDRAAIASATRQSHPGVQSYSEATADAHLKLPWPLEANMNYYWRVDGIDGSSGSVKNPDTWNFKTSPPVAWNPRPAEGKKGLGRLLRWNTGCFADETNGQDVYFGTSYDSVNNADTTSAEYMGRQSAATYDTSHFDSGRGLKQGDTYYWRVDQLTGDALHKGSVWQFTCWYRAIFNCDGHSVFAGAGDTDTWIKNIFEPVEDSHVDAVFWCDGSGGNTAKYDSEVLERWGERVGEPDPHLTEMIAEGNDPPLVVVREGHKRGLDVFYSLRINDIHDNFDSCAQELATFKIEHPEWTIGEGHPYGYKTALQFKFQEVRDIKFATIEELFKKYDFDGLEIDFMRCSTYAIPGTESENAHFLTQFLRRVREHLNKRAVERGRPIALAVRVDENLNACALDGFDVDTWIKQGLIDILAAGAGAGDIAVEEFKELASGTNVLIYPCLEAFGSWSTYRPRPTELRRATALNYWHQGADGIYTFNWFPHLTGKGGERDLFREIGDPEAMQSKPLIFGAEHHLTRVVRDYPHNWLHGVLPAELSNVQILNVPIMVGKDFTKSPQPTRMELVVHCSELSDDDEFKILLNHKQLLPERRSASLVNVPLNANQLKLGRNEVSFLAFTGEMTIDSVEIHVASSRH